MKLKLGSALKNFTRNRRNSNNSLRIDKKSKNEKERDMPNSPSSTAVTDIFPASLSSSFDELAISDGEHNANDNENVNETEQRLRMNIGNILFMNDQTPTNMNGSSRNGHHRMGPKTKRGSGRNKYNNLKVEEETEIPKKDSPDRIYSKSKDENIVMRTNARTPPISTQATKSISRTRDLTPEHKISTSPLQSSTPKQNNRTHVNNSNRIPPPPPRPPPSPPPPPPPRSRSPEQQIHINNTKTSVLAPSTLSNRIPASARSKPPIPRPRSPGLYEAKSKTISKSLPTSFNERDTNRIIANPSHQDVSNNNNLRRELFTSSILDYESNTDEEDFEKIDEEEARTLSFSESGTYDTNTIDSGTIDYDTLTYDTNTVDTGTIDNDTMTYDTNTVDTGTIDNDTLTVDSLSEDARLINNTNVYATKYSNSLLHDSFSFENPKKKKDRRRAFCNNNDSYEGFLEEDEDIFGGCIHYADAGCNSFQDSMLKGIHNMVCGSTRSKRRSRRRMKDDLIIAMNYTNT